MIASQLKLNVFNRPKSVPSSPMVVRAFSRLGSLTAGWGRSARSKQAQQQQLAAEDKKKWSSSQDCSENKDKDSKDKPNLPVPRLSVCADAQKVDRAKLAQTEVSAREKESLESLYMKLTLRLVIHFVSRLLPLLPKF